MRGQSSFLFAGNSNLPLAQNIAKYLEIPLGDILINTFSDGELQVEIKECVRGKIVYIIQSLSSKKVNDYIMELLFIADALRRADAEKVIAVIPYLGYSRQDRKSAHRGPISASVVLNILANAVDGIITFELHSDQIQGFIQKPMTHLYSRNMMIQALDTHFNILTAVVASPDAGGMKRATAYSRQLGNIPIAFMDKRRPAPNEVEVAHIIGNVEGQIVVIVDDMIDTAGTLCLAAHEFKNRGAKAVYATAVHGVLSGKAIQRIQDSCIEGVIITNSIPLPHDITYNKIIQIDCAPLFARIIETHYNGGSISMALEN